MGDAACWMHEVCLDCGTVSEDRRSGDPCSNCAAEAADQDQTVRPGSGS